MALVSCSDATGTGNTSKMVLKDIQAHFQARTDGSQSKTEFMGYLKDKLEGFGYQVTEQDFTCTIDYQGEADQTAPYDSTGVNLIVKKTKHDRQDGCGRSALRHRFHQGCRREQHVDLRCG